MKTSADAAGLAIMPALFNREDVLHAMNMDHPDDRHLGHALRFTLPTGWISQSFMLPSTNWTPSNVLDYNRAPFGMRLRLKADFDYRANMENWIKESVDNGYYDVRQGEVFVNTLKRYGMINCDNGLTLAIVGCPDLTGSNKWFDEQSAALFEPMKGRHFEAVEGKVYNKTNVQEAVDDTGLEKYNP